MKSETMTSGRWFVVLAAAALLLGGGAVVAQTTKDAAKPSTSTATPARGAGPGMGGPGMGGPGMGGPGMNGAGMGMGMGMGGMGMMGMCPAMGGADTKVEVKKIAKGVTITITSDDARSVTRIQKRGEAMRLMHEAASE
jgi:hypothetical protein